MVAQNYNLLKLFQNKFDEYNMYYNYEHLQVFVVYQFRFSYREGEDFVKQHSRSHMEVKHKVLKHQIDISYII